ncbi:MAG: DUF6438 domain-containing protein [Owenweeksia sp.]
MRKILLGISALSLLAGCASSTNATALKKRGTEFTFEVSTSPCFGSCPVYDMSIKESGLAVFNGKKFPDTKGDIFKSLPDEEMDSLRSVLAGSGLFEMDSVYDDPNITDLPGTTLTLTLGNGSSKTVRGRYNTPESFDEIKAFVERLRKRNFQVGK